MFPASADWTPWDALHCSATRRIPDGWGSLWNDNIERLALGLRSGLVFQHRNRNSRCGLAFARKVRPVKVYRHIVVTGLIGFEISTAGTSFLDVPRMLHTKVAGDSRKKI